MKDGSYIWNATIEYRWNYEVESDEDRNFEDFVISAPNFETACSKVMKVFYKNNKGWKDKDEEGVIHAYDIKEVQITRIERGDWING